MGADVTNVVAKQFALMDITGTGTLSAKDESPAVKTAFGTTLQSFQKHFADAFESKDPKVRALAEATLKMPTQGITATVCAGTVKEDAPLADWMKSAKHDAGYHAAEMTMFATLLGTIGGTGAFAVIAATATGAIPVAGWVVLAATGLYLLVMSIISAVKWAHGVRDYVAEIHKERRQDIAWCAANVPVEQSTLRDHLRAAWDNLANALAR